MAAEYTIKKGCLCNEASIIRLCWDFERYLSEELKLRSIAHDCEDRVREDFKKDKFLCHLANSKGGEFVGLTLSTDCRLSGVGAVLLLTVIYTKNRGRGIGKALLTSAIQETEERIKCNIQQVHFLCNSVNLPAWEFYKRFGAVNLTQDTGYQIFQFDIPHDLSGNDKVCVRPAKQSDIPQLVTLFKELRHAYGLSLLSEDSLEESNGSLQENVYVASNERDEILGMVSFYFRYSVVAARVLVIVGFIVKDGQRRIGICSAIFKHLFQMVIKEYECNVGNVLLPPDELSPARFFLSRFSGLINRTVEDTWNYCYFDRPKF